MKTHTFILVLLIIFQSCTEKEEFSKSDWEYGSEGNFPKREKYIEYLRNNEHEFVGKTEKEVLNIFGEASRIRIEDNTKHLIYDIIEDFGWSIDPQYLVSFRIIIVDNKVLKAEIKESPDNRSFFEKI